MARERKNNAAGQPIGNAILPPTISITTRDGNNNPTAWTEEGISCSATYNDDGTVATLTKGSTTRTFTYSNSLLTGVS